MRWHTIGASVRGSAHVQRGAPNEDSFASIADERCAVIAVADGHGSQQCFRSKIGSELATSVALAAASEWADLNDPEVAVADLGSRIVARWSDSVQEHLAANPFETEELELLGGLPAPYAYGSTVLVAGCTDRIGFAAQLGDGHIVLVDADGAGSLAFENEKKVATETNSLCLDEAEQFFRSRTWPLDGSHPRIVAASTDGWGDAFEDIDWYVATGRQLSDRLGQSGPAEIQKQLEGWLSRPAAEFGDDTTMAILFESDQSVESITPVTDESVGPNLALADDVGPQHRAFRRFGLVTIALASIVGGWFARVGFEPEAVAATPGLWTASGRVLINDDGAALDRSAVGSGPTTILVDDVAWHIDGSELRVGDVEVTTLPDGLVWSALALDGSRVLLAEAKGRLVFVFDSSCASIAPAGCVPECMIVSGTEGLNPLPCPAAERAETATTAPLSKAPDDGTPDETTPAPTVRPGVPGVPASPGPTAKGEP